MRSICSTGPPPTTRTVGPRCSSGSATRNDRPVIPTHRETLLAAGRLADDVDAIDILVRAALRNNRGWNSIAGAVDHERVEMLTRALTRLGDADSPDRARLLALLCVERTWDADFDERLSMATQAVDIARRTGDNAALVDAIRLCHESITMPQTLELRLRWNTEACDLADDLGDPTARLHANDCRSFAALEAGDLATMRTACAIFESESERIGQPLNRWQIAYHRAWQRMLEGDLDAAEQSATEALTLGTAAGYPDDARHDLRHPAHRPCAGCKAGCTRWSRSSSRPRTTTPDSRSSAPFSHSRRASTIAHDEVRQLLDAEVTNDFPMFADSTWLVAHVLWADAAARSGHRPAATVLYQRLLPWHDQFATTHITVHGSVAHYLGLLAHTLDRHDEADQWFSQALAFHEAMEAPFFVALTQTAWAELLADRDQPGDAQRARALVDAALPVATERGYGYVERDARSVLERIE